MPKHLRDYKHPRARIDYAIAILAWRQHEYGYPYGSVEECAKGLGWNLPHCMLMEAKPND